MYSQSELRELDIESWKRKLEGGEPEEWCPANQSKRNRISLDVTGNCY